jgi:hypothetical protein
MAGRHERENKNKSRRSRRRSRKGGAVGLLRAGWLESSELE